MIKNIIKKLKCLLFLLNMFVKNNLGEIKGNKYFKDIMKDLKDLKEDRVEYNKVIKDYFNGKSYNHEFGIGFPYNQIFIIVTKGKIKSYQLKMDGVLYPEGWENLSENFGRKKRSKFGKWFFW